MNTIKTSSAPIANSTLPTSASTSNTQQPSGGNASRVSTSQDTFSMTASAAELQSLPKELNNRPVVDEQRVDRMRQAITNGTFKVNAVRIADKLLNTERAYGAESGIRRHVQS